MRVLDEDNLAATRDDFYEMLMKAHEGKSTEESHALNIRLVLLMANAIGDFETLRELFKRAQQ